MPPRMRVFTEGFLNDVDVPKEFYTAQHRCLLLLGL
jgi:hypothetical protein